MKDDETESKARAFQDAAAAVPGASVDELRGRLQAALEGTHVVGERLGEGGMGAVFLAQETKLNRQVAIKVMRPVEGVQAEDWLRRFEQEASALASLSHPGIVTVFGSGQTSDLAWIIMEAVEGTSLRELLSQDALTPAEALAIAPDMCRALQYAHEHGIVHRDIKPENVLVDVEGRVKLVDFGLAMLRSEDGSRLTQREEVLGTLRYMAPEQLDTPLEVDHRADIFSMGVVLYEMLTGKVPHGIVRPPSTQVSVDVRFDEVVLRSLEREPERRYQLASDLVDRMEEIEAGPATATVPTAAGGTIALSPEADLQARRLQYRSGRVLDVAVVAASVALFAAFRMRIAGAFGLGDWAIQAGLLVTLALALPLFVAALVSIDRTRISLPVVRVLSALLALGMLVVAGVIVGGFDGDESRAGELAVYFRAMLMLPMLPLLTAALSARYPISFVWGEQAARAIWGLALVIALVAAATSAYPLSDPTQWIQYAILAVYLGTAVLLFVRPRRESPDGSLQGHAVLVVIGGLMATALTLSIHHFVPAESVARQPTYAATLFLGALLTLVGGVLGAGGGATLKVPGRLVSDGERG